MAFFVSLFLLIPGRALAENSCRDRLADALAFIREPITTSLHMARNKLDRRDLYFVLRDATKENRGPFDYEKLLKLVNESANPSYIESFEALWPKNNLLLVRVGEKKKIQTKSVRFENIIFELFGEKASPQSEMAKAILDAVFNSKEVLNWMLDLKKSIFREMWEAGIQIPDMSTPAVREYFMDIVLAKKAKAAGFEINEKGLPFDLYSYGSANFFRFLSKKRVFVDWAGTSLERKIPHFSRGHLIQMVYLGEHVRGFDELIQYIGETRDQHKIWYFLIDNPNQSETQYAGSWWMLVFKTFLGVRY